MATSATSTYNLTAQRIIDLALVDLGVAGQGSAVDPILRQQALDHLNLILKDIDAEAGLLWRTVRRTQALTAGQASYVLAEDVSDLDQPARYTQSGATFGSQVQAMARDEYMRLPDRTLAGTSYQYYAEKSLDAAGIQIVTLFLYPVPPTTGDTLEYAANLKGRDVVTLDQTLDIPQKGMTAVRWGLAHSLGPSYNTPVDKLSYLNARYVDAKRMLILDDNERGDVQIVPFGGTTYGYGFWGSR